ncbi:MULTISPECIES: Rrf2 family transcriptional regulator [unclassified Moraxella]|uniref:Rrf2 family transcriptional regulator n=1 Tax=unclassified Moraxella TaxID=2685852 RepID=UPI00359E9A22
MRLTTRGRYAVTALLDLAVQENRHQGAISLSDIAKRQSISISYLEQLFSKLRKKGLVNSTRGASGGYHLAKPLNEIDVMSIITAVDESVNAMQCGGKGDCQDGAMCLTHDLWHNLSAHIEAYLSQVTLADLLHSKNTQNIADRQEHKRQEHKFQSIKSDKKDQQINTINLLGVKPV